MATKTQHPAVGAPGAASWKTHYSRIFEDFDVVLVLADGDEAGLEFGKRIQPTNETTNSSAAINEISLKIHPKENSTQSAPKLDYFKRYASAYNTDQFRIQFDKTLFAGTGNLIVDKIPTLSGLL